MEEDLGLPVTEDFRDAGIDGQKLLSLDESGLSLLLGVEEATLYDRLSSHINALSKAPPPPPPSASPNLPVEVPKLSARQGSPGPRIPKLSLKSMPGNGRPGSSVSTSCISSPRHSPSISPRSQLFATKASSPRGSIRASSPQRAWSSFGSTNQSCYFDTSPRRCLSPSKEHIGPGPAPAETSSKRMSPRVKTFQGEERRTPWLYTRAQASPGPKYTAKAAHSRAARFDKSPRGGCSSVRVELPPRYEYAQPGPGSYHPQYQHLSTFK